MRGARWTVNVGPYIERGNGVVTGAPDVLLAVPAVGTWSASGDFALNGATAAPFRVRCTQSGTFGTLSVTASTTAGSNLATFSNVTGLRAGQYVTITGAGADRNLITSIVGVNVTFATAFPNAVSAADAAYSSPVFVSY